MKARIEKKLSKRLVELYPALYCSAWRGEHPHTAEQANLPTMFGALQGVVLAATVDPRGTCAGCAYRLGTPANTSPVTTSDAIYCRQELSRFYCHADLDDQGNPVRTCVGHAKAMKQDATK